MGCRLPLDFAEAGTLEIRLASRSFRGVRLKKMGKRGVS